MKKMKNVVALTMAATMVVGSALSVLADGVTGSGAIEYDNAAAISYDSVQVPTLVAADYDMTLDPTGLLKQFDSVTYAANKTVYFKKTTVTAKIDADKSGGATTDGDGNTTYAGVYKKTTAEENTLNNLVEEVTLDGEGKVTAVVTVASDYMVWVPDSSNAGRGKFETITKDNVLNYFDVTATGATAITAVTAKVDHLSGTNVFDGKLYKNTFTKLTGDVDAADYVTLNSAGTAVQTVTALYKADGTAVAANDVTIIPATTAYTDTTNSVTVTNKSTKAKTVTATVTLQNADGLTISNSSTFADTSKAAVYIAATNGTKTVALAKEDDVVSAEYTVDLAAATITPVKYQAQTKTDIGGHNYEQYENYNPTYTSDSFYITAAANSDTAAKDAWDTYAKAALEAKKAPTLNVVYTIADKQDKVTVTYNENKPAGVEANVEGLTSATAQVVKGAAAGTLPTPTLEGYTLEGWFTDAACTEGNEFEATTTVSADVTVYAKWTEEYTDIAGTIVVADGVFYIGTSSTTGFTEIEEDDISSVAVNGKSLTSEQLDIQTNGTGTWIGVPATSIIAVDEDNNWAVGTEWTFVTIIDSNRYTATYTQQ